MFMKWYFVEMLCVFVDRPQSQAGSPSKKEKKKRTLRSNSLKPADRESTGSSQWYTSDIADTGSVVSMVSLSSASPSTAPSTAPVYELTQEVCHYLTTNIV